MASADATGQPVADKSLSGESAPNRGVTRNDSPATGDRSLAHAYDAVRRFTEALCKPLCTEDFVVQSMSDTSPTRWHLAHATWFFETFVLKNAVDGYQSPHPIFEHLFNSYYNAVGEVLPRPMRGLLSRPRVDEVFAYRHHVDRHMRDLLRTVDPCRDADLAEVIETGIHHEQQHQELILTDIKHIFAQNPINPGYQARETRSPQVLVENEPAELSWIRIAGGLHWIGHDGCGFSYDHERPRHQVYVEPFELAARLTNNAEYLRFIEDGGYLRPELWLSDGWDAVMAGRWFAPLYWRNRDGQWDEFTLAGLRPLEPADPVCHVSFYEADAYARWCGASLPTEAAWEVAGSRQPIRGNFAESGRFHPDSSTRDPDGQVGQLFGDTWEWTSSPYVAYPGFRPSPGMLGEYNGKFMCNQMVLRGGSCVTPQTHIRGTYRNFFPPNARWQFTGIRLCR